MDALLRSIAEWFDLPLSSLTGRSRVPSLVRARHCAFAVLRELTPSTLVEIGHVFGRDHSTVVHGIGRALTKHRPTYDALLDALSPSTVQEMADRLGAFSPEERKAIMAIAESVA